jgi:hypothetical protein
MRRTLTMSILAVALVSTPLVCRKLRWGYRSSRTSDQRCFHVVRPYYPLRHWSWSGIPLLEGGFISDPHFLCSEPMALPAPVAKMLPDQSAFFQIVDVNPFFNDRSSEILVLIRTNTSISQHSLQYPRAQGVQAVVATPDSPPARIFPYRQQLALLTNFFGPARGIYLLPLPLKSGSSSSLIPVNDPQFDAIAGEFRDVAQDPTIRDQFCESRRKDFISFYEKYADSCHAESESTQKDSAKSRFNEFWKND